MKKRILSDRSSNAKSNQIITMMCHWSRILVIRRLLVACVFLSSLPLAQIGAHSTELSKFDDSEATESSSFQPDAMDDNFSPTRQPNAATTTPLRPRLGDQAAPRRAESGGSGSQRTPFKRVNELDVFLDDMNHNELRAVATGKSIGPDYLFRPRPLTGQLSSSPEGQLRKQATINSTAAIGEGGGPHSPASGIDEMRGSQSERQIYSECALILQRTYVKNIDHPKHQQPVAVPFGKTEQACISYKHIDKAIEEAKHILKFKELAKSRRKQKPKRPALDVIHKTLEPPQDLIAAIGELNMATTQILANQFDLSNDELLNGLPLIDMSKTKFWPLCPALVKQDIKCELSRFRTLTGHCNNLKHPTWGAAMTPFARYLPPVHPDGIWLPRKSIVTEFVFEMNHLEPAAEMQHHHQHHHHMHLPNQPMGEPREPSIMRPDFADAAGDFEHMRSSASVRFESHAPPPSGQMLMPGQQQPQPQQQLMHYQETRSPASPFLASSTPMGGGGGYGLEAAEARRQHQRHRTDARQVALELPSARLVTSVVHRDLELPSHDFSILFMSWGQLLDHDMTRAAQSPPSIKCCPQTAAAAASTGAAGDEQPSGGGGGGQRPHRLCLPIRVPDDDPFYAKHNVQCLEFRRTLAGLRPNCVLGPRVHQNAITAPIDANFVYGSSQAQSDSLRLFRGGRLRDRDWFKSDALKPLLPAQDVDPDLECIARPKDLFCFLAGDVRVNEQTHLTVLHTVYMREHNRIADRLSELNPHWDDERTFQETRHIMAAGVQHVLINEYIPLLIGKKMADLYNLTAVPAERHALGGALYWRGYDPGVTTSVANSFAAAAFRQGHTFVAGSFERYNKFHEFVASERLRHLFKRPFLLYQPGVMDELIAGMINQASQSYDPFISEDISGHLFQPPELAFGHDLAAINLQRGREQGLPGYNLFREWCGLPRAETFEQLEPYLTNQTAFQYSRLYKHVDDIDLWSGGVSERKLPGAAIGPTFACIIARQFSNTRRGDRFWYELPGLPSSFTPDQLLQIRRITLAKILCANSDDLPTIQRWALRLAHPVLNPRLPCEQLPEMDLRAWQEE